MDDKQLEIIKLLPNVTCITLHISLMLFGILDYFNEGHIILIDVIILYLLIIDNIMILSCRMGDRFNIEMHHGVLCKGKRRSHI